MDAVGELPDAELLTRHTQGDDRAFGELVRRHRDRLWAVAVRTLGDPEEASDALQDAFVSAFRAAHRFRGDSAVTTWLHRIVVNACLDRMRRRMVRPATPVGDDANLDTLALGHGKGVVSDPTGSSDAAMDVKSALLQLPMEQRSALVLVDMLGYPVDEVARILDVAVGTVKSRCARGRARLLPHVAHLRNRNQAPHVSSEGGGGSQS
ncbi:RNA polymerase sigma factor SigM [Allonocardiopsis opalescens]|uniref:RNA polymerase ECF family sigma subunit n=1 Tax=Allonocardiopsis opalescens TaxID=1144618 RepID=A0A2T0Q770_9ACTN|nr:RNA polymerase sigma factor SigM [Allonocardiopsis opalescens]PRX99563.1 RNA polymerase ECF family sigma subunit [Allonocardiopsis opalescens]